MLQTLEGVRKIILRNITFIIGYLTNIVVMGRLSKGGVYQNSERPDMFIKNGFIYTNLQSHGQYQVLESRLGFNIKLLVEYLIYAITKRSTRLNKRVKKSANIINKVITTEFIYIMFAYLSLEVISHLKSVIKNVKIDISTLSPTTIQYKICGVSKTDNKEMIRELETI